MRPNADVIRETITFKKFTHILRKGIRHSLPAFFEQLSSRWLGAPFLPALALLGAVRRPWRQPLASSRLFVLLVPATTVLATFSVLWIFSRFYFILAPFLLLWAANGLVEVGRWTKATASAAGLRGFGSVTSEYLIPGLIGLAVIAYPIKGVRALDVFKEGSPSSLVAKDLGLWIRQQQNRAVRIMGTIPLAFHADAEFVQFPYCSAELALRYLDAVKVDYVILHRGERYTRYYEDWLAKGIPDSRAERVDVPLDVNGEFVVYRWHGTDAPSSGALKAKGGPG
jgi:hypothetical protein